MAQQKRSRPIGSKDSVPWEKLIKHDIVANNDKNLKKIITSKEQIIYKNIKNPNNIQNSEIIRYKARFVA